MYIPPSSCPIPHQTLLSLVGHYEKIRELVDEACQKLEEASAIARDVFGREHSYIAPHREFHVSPNMAHERDLCTMTMQENAWQYALNKTGIRDFMSSSDRQRLENQFRDHTTPAFTIENLVSTLRGLHENRDQIFKDAVTECFDRLRPWQRTWGKVYKTNKTWMVGQKVIIENACNGYGLSYGYKHDLLFDLDKVFHGLDGKGMPKHPGDAVTAIKTAMRDKEDQTETEYFAFKWYLKTGTIHVKFKRLDLLQEFNRLGAEGVAAKDAKENGGGRGLPG